jgi:serine/threonine-protein kinase
MPGSQVAGYLLTEQIGQGGMAVVFRAHDERLDRTVALKILSPALADDEAFRLRFIRESKAAAAVDHPHIIPVFEAGEGGGALFIAMRHVSGGDAHSLISQNGPLAPVRAAEIVSQVASALDAAHAKGLVHRDVKPANMLLDASTGKNRPDHVYLSDFGLTKVSMQASALTGTGMVLGTLDYISPEQITGRPVNGRTDQYALACAAFELLTGAVPFARDEAMSVMYAQLSEPPPSVTSRRRDLPLAANQVFTRALSKDSANRYESCGGFADALREALQTQRPGSPHPADLQQSDPIPTEAVPKAGQIAQTSGVGSTPIDSGMAITPARLTKPIPVGPRLQGVLAGACSPWPV